jgi:RecA-family ATPase
LRLTRNLINALEESAKTETEQPVLAVLDTLQRGLGGDDSDTGDSAAGLVTLDRIRARWPEMAILLVHHVGQADKSRTRGVYLWRAALDQEFRIEKSDPKNTADTTINLRHTKAKESEPEPAAMIKTSGCRYTVGVRKNSCRL